MWWGFGCRESFTLLGEEKVIVVRRGDDCVALDWIGYGGVGNSVIGNEYYGTF